MEVKRQAFLQMSAPMDGLPASRQSRPSEHSANPKERYQVDHVAAREANTGSMDLQQESTSHNAGTLKQSDLAHPVREATNLEHSDICSSVREDLRSGNFSIPPFRGSGNTDVPTDSPVVYQFPPALLGSDAVSQHRRRFDRSILVPNSDLPLSSQIMGYARTWGEWIAQIPDEEKREQLLDRVYEMATKAWFEAIRVGYKPDVVATRRAAPKAPTKRPAKRVEELPLALRSAKPKRDPLPAEVPVVVAGHDKGLAWAVTAGELQEAGVSETRIHRRAADRDSLEEDGEKLVVRVLDDYNGGIAPKDWYDIEEKTELNPWGRDLQAYCVYEILKSRASVVNLEGYYERQKGRKQRENTQRRIDEENERGDLFMALALELDEDNPRSPTPPVPGSSSVRAVSMSSVSAASTADIVHTHQLESLVNAVGTILQETEIAYMISTLELYKISEAEIKSDTSTEAMTSVERCEQVLREILFGAREWQTLTDNPATDVDTSSQTRELELQIARLKEILGDLLPTLVVEQDATSTDLNGDNKVVDKTIQAVNFSDEDVMMSEASDLALSSPAKRPAEPEENGAPENQAPVTKKLRSEGHRRHSEVEVLVPLIEQGGEGFDQSDKEPLTSTKVGSNSTELMAETNALKAGRRITLHIRPDWDPARYTSEKVFHCEGFSYRYARESTMAQRVAMTDILIRYVQDCNHQRNDSNNGWRFGKYQYLTHPDDPTSTTIIHGVWNLKDGSRPGGFERFYGGKADYSAELDNALMSDTEAEDDEEPRPPPSPKRMAITKPKHKEPTTQSHERNARSGITEVNKGRAGSLRGRNKPTHTSTSSIKNHVTMTKPKYKPTKPRLNLNLSGASAQRASSNNKTMTATRPRRQTTPKNYNEQIGYEDEDDEYNPSEPE